MGGLESRAWVAYYRRQWLTLLWSAVGLVRHTGKLVAPDDLRTSSLVVPHQGSSLDEVRSLLAEGA